MLNSPCDRIRATKHTPRNTFSVLERRHGLVEIVERGVGVGVERWYALGRAEAVEILLRHGADVHHEDNQDLLHAAACFGSVDVATLLLDAGVSVEHVVPDEASSVWNPDRGVFEYYEGWTPLFEAVRSGQFDVVRLLLSRGADPERRDSKGYTAFRHGQRISGMSERPEYFEVARECTRCLELFVTVRVAGGYGRYVRAPRIQLLVLRVLCERGRARPPRRRRGGVLAGMFGETSPLPQECFWRICEYWRGIRDYGSAWPENVGSPSGPDIPGRREQRENRER